MKSASPRRARYLALATLCVSLAAGTQAAEDKATSAARIALQALETRYGGKYRIEEQVDLTQAFGMATPWTLIVAKETDKVADWGDPNPMSYCFVHAEIADCDPEIVQPSREFRELDDMADTGGRHLFEYKQARLVHMPPPDREPLLFLQACTHPSGDGDCAVCSFLLAYERAKDRFIQLFTAGAERNRNGTARFIERGPLAGNVVLVQPTDDAPYAYWMTVFRRNAAGRYESILRYRSKTRYGDGNPLPTIDSDMAELLRQLGLWKPGNPLPVPQPRPEGCEKLVLKHGSEWCQWTREPPYNGE